MLYTTAVDSCTASFFKQRRSFHIRIPIHSNFRRPVFLCSVVYLLFRCFVFPVSHSVLTEQFLLLCMFYIFDENIPNFVPLYAISNCYLSKSVDWFPCSYKNIISKAVSLSHFSKSSFYCRLCRAVWRRRCFDFLCCHFEIK